MPPAGPRRGRAASEPAARAPALHGAGRSRALLRRRPGAGLRRIAVGDRAAAGRRGRGGRRGGRRVPAPSSGPGPCGGTLHFVAAADVRWMLRPARAARSSPATWAAHRQLELEPADFARARKILTRSLESGRRLTRPSAYELLKRGGVSPAGQRGIHIVGHLAQKGLICFGPWEGKQPTFVLLDEWIPRQAGAVTRGGAGTPRHAPISEPRTGDACGTSRGGRGCW